MNTIKEILNKQDLDRDDLIFLLGVKGEEQKCVFSHAESLKDKSLGRKVYFRGLIEFSNYCAKDCFYCGIRKSNTATVRYNLEDDEIVGAAIYAHQQKYSSIVLQSGELSSGSFTKRITGLLKKIHKKTAGELRITLSLGEQSRETYREWYENGARRYLLRIETSNALLYEQIHPNNPDHQFLDRLAALKTIQETGYQTGTGVMIGLPFQTKEDLADDLIFMKHSGIDMVGMGPYIEHKDTPLLKHKEFLWPIKERFYMSLKMIALLRIIMPKINIAAATALQSIDKMGREKAIKLGANVIMPNITPGKYRNYYRLYDNKPCIDEETEDCTSCLSARIAMTNNEIAFGEWGDSLSYTEKAIKL